MGINWKNMNANELDPIGKTLEEMRNSRVHEGGIMKPEEIDRLESLVDLETIRGIPNDGGDPA